MKRILLSVFLIASISLSAQVTDTVSVGASYANQVWYSLENDEQGSVALSSWDFGFEISGFTSSIIANTSLGAELYKYPNGDTANWSTLDTSGIATWTAWHNSPTSWAEGAFNQGIDTSNALDLGWGKYNFITHHVTGDSLFVWKSANGTYKKIWIENLASGTYNFKIADLNGNNLKQVAIVKSLFAGKAFAYYHVAQDSIKDLEPAAANWDLIFGKYIDFVPTPYSVSGIRTNANVQTAKVYPVNNTATYNGYSIANYTYDINTIGHDWKYFDFGTFSYLIEDSTVYFAKIDTVYWKLIMQGFGGSSNGNYIFSKEKISQTTSIVENKEKIGTIMLYPNPSVQRNVSLVTDFKEAAQATLRVLNLNGQAVMQENITVNAGLNTEVLNLENVSKGVYIIRLDHPKGSLNQKLILK
tara:strand:+ start:2223 stop:3467 length:1245 start_codon:yes stop_codon:yes gene_type:complete